MMKHKTKPLRSDHRPLYMRAIEALEGWFQEEQYQPGDRLPAESELAESLGISRSTLREAMGHLETQGRVIRKQGIGTFMAQPPVDLLGGVEELESLRSRARKLDLEARTIERNVSIVGQDAVWRDHFPPSNGSLVRVESVEAISGWVIAYIDSYAPEHLINLENIQRFDGTLLEFLNERGDRKVSHTRSDVYAIDADIDLAAMLRVPVNKSLLYMLEVYFGPSGDPLGLSKNYFDTDHYHFHIHRRVVRPGRFGEV